MFCIPHIHPARNIYVHLIQTLLFLTGVSQIALVWAPRGEDSADSVVMSLSWLLTVSWPEPSFFLLRSSLLYLLASCCFCEKHISKLEGYQQKAPIACELVYLVPNIENLLAKPSEPEPLVPAGFAICFCVL